MEFGWNTDGGGGQRDVDPVLVHLMRNARSSAVQKEFLKVPASSFTNEHSVKLLVGHCSL